MEVTIELNPVTAFRNWNTKRKAAKKLAAFKARRNEYLRRAKMSEPQWNTGVVKATDDSGYRLLVSSAYDNGWGDCISIGFRHENEPRGEWKMGHFSPSRARVLCEMIMQRVEAIEEFEPSSMNIDKDDPPK
jgi:hypothetical protein